MSEILEPANGGQPEGGSPTPDNSPAASPPTEGGSWRDKLSDDLKSNPTLSNFDSVENLAKSYVHAQSLIGKKGVFIPSEKASEEEWKGFYEKLGVPKFEEYKLELPKDLQVQEDVAEKFREFSHKHGLLPKQSQALLNDFLSYEVEKSKEVQAQFETKKQETVAALKREWGEDYDNKIRIARLAATEYGGKDMLDKLSALGLTSDPDIIKLLSNAGESLREARLHGTDLSSTRSHGDIDRAISDLMNDPAYLDATHTSHRVKVDQMAQLFMEKEMSGAK